MGFGPLLQKAHLWTSLFLQDPLSSKGFLPGFSEFKFFAPQTARPKVAGYAAENLLRCVFVLLVFIPESDDLIAVDVYTPQGCFGSTFSRFRIDNAYTRPINPPSPTVTPETSLINCDSPHLVAGNFNLYNPAVDPFRILSSSEQRELAPYFEKPPDLGFALLNTPGTYTRLPFSSSHRTSAIDLVFANPHMFPAFKQSEATSLPSTGTDLVPILIFLQPLSPNSPQLRPPWEDTDGPILERTLEGWRLPPPPLKTIS